MSQRLLKFHPKTGALLEPLYVSPTGRAFWPILGASPDDPSNDDGTGGDGDDDGSNDDDGTDSEGQGSEGGQGEQRTYTAEEYEAIRNRMRAADQRASAAEKKVKDAEDAKKDDLTKANDRVKELEAQSSTLQKEISGLRLENAFLAANDQQWHDADMALAEAQRGNYLENVIDEDGSIDKKALKSALKKLATEKKFLVKSSTSSTNDDDDEGDNPSGGNVGNGTKNKEKKASEASLRQKYPALNL